MPRQKINRELEVKVKVEELIFTPTHNPITKRQLRKLEKMNLTQRYRLAPEIIGRRFVYLWELSMEDASKLIREFEL